MKWQGGVMAAAKAELLEEEKKVEREERYGGQCHSPEPACLGLLILSATWHADTLVRYSST